MPLFVDTPSLRQHGFRSEPGPLAPPPSTPAVPGLTPVRTFAADPAAQRWVKSEALADRATRHEEMGVTADGRVVWTKAMVTDQQGQVLEDSGQSVGAVHVYDPVAVPPAAWLLSHEGEEACRG